MPPNLFSEELESKIGAALDKLEPRAPSPAKKGAIEGWLSSPFVVTVVGGLLLSAITLRLQSNQENAREEEKRQQVLQDRKYEAMLAFTEGITDYLKKVKEVRQREFFIKPKLKIPDKSRIVFPDGRSWSENIIRWEHGMEHLYDKGSPDALCARCESFFETEEVLSSIRDFDTLMDRHSEAQNNQDLSELHTQAVIDYQIVVRLMGKELKQNTAKEQQSNCKDAKEPTPES